MLERQARRDADERVAAPFVAVRLPDTRVLGDYTLSASVLSLADFPDDSARKLPQPSRLFVPLNTVARLLGR